MLEEVVVEEELEFPTADELTFTANFGGVGFPELLVNEAILGGVTVCWDMLESIWSGGNWFGTTEKKQIMIISYY